MKLTDIIKPNIPCVIIKNNNLTYKWDGTFLWTSDGLKCSLTKTFLFDTDFEYIDWQSYAKSFKLQQEEIKAWEIVALHWENATQNYNGAVTAKYNNKQFYGMCRFITRLTTNNIISEITQENILTKIDRVLVGVGSFLAPLTFEGAQVRVQFCRDQIQKIKQGR